MSETLSSPLPGEGRLVWQCNDVPQISRRQEMSHLTELDRQRIEYGLRQGMSYQRLALNWANRVQLLHAKSWNTINRAKRERLDGSVTVVFTDVLVMPGSCVRKSDAKPHMISLSAEVKILQPQRCKLDNHMENRRQALEVTLGGVSPLHRNESSLRYFIYQQYKEVTIPIYSSLLIV